MDTRFFHSILLVGVLLFPAIAAEGQDKPSATIDEAVKLLEQAKREFESALAMAERQNKALIATIRSQAQTITDLKRQLADCQARSPSPEVVPRLNLFHDVWSRGLEAEFAEAGANIIYILYDHRIGPGGHVDEALLRASLAEYIPDEAVYACLDMEDEYQAAITDNAPGTPAYEAGIDEYIKAMTIAREVRPKAKWAWWGFPFQTKWTHDTQKSFYRLTPEEYEREAAYILRHTRLNDLPDWFTPDGYDFWIEPPAGTDDPKWRATQHSSLKARLDFTRRIAGNKPILVSTSHRRYVKGHGLLPIDDWYTDQVAVALAGGADGMVWWGADQWYFSAGRIPAEEINPKTPQVQARRYFDALARRLFDHYRQWLSPE